MKKAESRQKRMSLQSVSDAKNYHGSFIDDTDMSKQMAWNPHEHDIADHTVTIPRQIMEPRVPMDPIMHGKRFSRHECSWKRILEP